MTLNEGVVDEDAVMFGVGQERVFVEEVGANDRMKRRSDEEVMREGCRMST